MDISNNPDYIKSSKLVFISAGLGFVNVLLAPGIFRNPEQVIIVIFTLLFLMAIGLGIYYGLSWIKYVLAAIIILGFRDAFAWIMKELVENPLNAIISILQNVTQIWATVLLFKENIKKT
ncbi:hypothetical protein [Flavobacterium psychrotrophum]|uniref:hypothetical protein n=1 Tax=Flavobacterium psychrotrophum TaxID=2294119 RepID=UPI000E324D16|nr:hypothetical protein [Flavobacterium psychrotrophum]